ncbi:hypothetical protein TNCV_4384991 [Trichonephila clavipes]|nr:hypothetical protein TNCV_4384991 [Trichonephila clavipes]
MRSNKSCVLVMPSEATTICAMRSSTVATGVSYTSYFSWPQKNISKGLISGEYGGQASGLPRPVHLPGYEA